VPRPTSRIVLLDPSDRILLFLYVSPATGRRWWITPGGGVDSGETFEAAARRELREETGLTDVELGPWIWSHEHEMTWLGQPVRMQERFFLVRAPTADVDVSGFDEFERAVLPEHRWWTLAELEDAAAGFGPDEALAPKELPRLLAAILAGQVPTDPVAIHHLPPRRERPG
jgi:8-oxo-dGTP pyrophosphatase MutT (NUDIX family)